MDIKHLVGHNVISTHVYAQLPLYLISLEFRANTGKIVEQIEQKALGAVHK